MEWDAAAKRKQMRYCSVLEPVMTVRLSVYLRPIIHRKFTIFFNWKMKHILELQFLGQHCVRRVRCFLKNC